jgi:hypothetical protein
MIMALGTPLELAAILPPALVPNKARIMTLTLLSERKLHRSMKYSRA